MRKASRQTPLRPPPRRAALHKLKQRQSDQRPYEESSNLKGATPGPARAVPSPTVHRPDILRLQPNRLPCICVTAGSDRVAQRTREIGLRLALGSRIGKAIAYVAGAGARVSAAGLVIGLSLCALALPVMRSVLYGVGVYDAPTLIAVTATLALVTLAATILPALRIAQIDPATTLRDE